MDPEEIRILLRAEPFVPFRLELSNGKAVDIMHPELAFLTKGTLFLGRPVEDPTLDIPDRADAVSMLHVVKAEMLTQAA